ncbi:MAG: TIGR01620 family protein [Pseudomonadota bacterium]
MAESEAEKPAGPGKPPPTDKRRGPRVIDLDQVELEPEPIPEPMPVEAQSFQPPPKAKTGRWLALFCAAFLGLLGLGFTLWIEDLVRRLFAMQPALGWVAVGLAALAALGLIGFILREFRSIARLSSLEKLRQDAQHAFEEGDRKAARTTAQSLNRIYSTMTHTARGRGEFAAQSKGVFDADALLILAEHCLLSDLDQQATDLISRAARRVSLVTALSPRALIDIAMVAFQCISLTRQIAELYGSRPGLLGSFKLARHMVAHLALTGGLAATEGLVSSVLGHSLAARLSSRLGEGVINGLLTARVGIAAVAVMRPLPYFEKEPPSLTEVTRGFADFRTSGEKSSASS